MSSKGKLIILAAFTRTDDGDLVPAFEPKQVDTEDRAVRQARMMVGSYAGVMVWVKDVNPPMGEYGPPAILFQAGEIQVLE